MVKIRSPLHAKIPAPDLLEMSRQKRQIRDNEAVPDKVKRQVIHADVADYPESEILGLDEQTLRDLQIFDSDSGGPTLFRYLDRTRNVCGAKVLHARMRRPLSSAQRIRDVQSSIQFILEHKSLFEHLPGHVTTNHIEIYLNGTLPQALSSNVFEFLYEVLDIRFGYSFHYGRVIHGVETSSSFIRTLREFVGAAEFDSAPGELGRCINEMRKLLSNRHFDAVTQKKSWDMFAWKVLRIDQVFRLHQKSNLVRLLQLTYEIDALRAMSLATEEYGLVMPELFEGELRASSEGLYHPLVADAVANPFQLDQQKRFLFLTGPNMAGKTTYLRACGIAIYMAHLGMGVPADKFIFSPAQSLLSSISLTDDLNQGVSYFRAEAYRIKAVASALAKGNRVVAILDEPFKGTNVKDALDASIAIMKRFASYADSLYLFSSHLIEMESEAKNTEQVDFCHFEAKENTEPLTFDYKIKPGVSDQRLGMRVLAEEGIFKLLDAYGAATVQDEGDKSLS